MPVRIDWRIATGGAAVLAVVFAWTSNPGVLGFHQSFPTRLFGAAMDWGLWLALLPLVFAVGARGHARSLGDWRNVAYQLAAGVSIALLHSAGIGVIRWFTGTAPSRGFLGVFNAFIALTFSGSLLRYALISAVYHAIAYHRDVRDRDVKQARMAQTLAEARLENLEARLQPHFLFNALNTIAALIRKDPPAAAAMVGQLSDLLRAALNTEVGREVTLAGELQLLDRYMAIQRTRFSDRLSFSVDATPEVLGAYVPQMILQPLVENAVRHGIGPRETAGAVDVHAARHGSMLRLVVRDDGVGFGRAPASLHGNGLGLRSARARLAHLYGSEFSFDIRASEPTGTVVTIDVPFHTSDVRRLAAAT